VLGVRAENADNAFSLDHLALGADLLDRRPNLHLVTSLDPLKTFEFRGLPSFNFPDPPSRSIVLRQLDLHPVAGHEPDEVGAQTVGDVSEDLRPIFELDPKDSVREGLQDPTANEVGRLRHEA